MAPSCAARRRPTSRRSSSHPSVQVTAQPGGFSIDIRGQGGDMPSGTTQGSVALEFDGVYSILSQSSIVGFFDVDRVEVLPGPQSTRYGPNADGGVVNVITKDPILNDASGAAS
jgi:iron complex outermembrane receptor protein